jgi:hypothetical protein
VEMLARHFSARIAARLLDTSRRDVEMLARHFSAGRGGQTCIPSPVGTVEDTSYAPSASRNQSSLWDSSRCYFLIFLIPALKCRAKIMVSLRDTPPLDNNFWILRRSPKTRHEVVKTSPLSRRVTASPSTTRARTLTGSMRPN